MVRTKGSSSNLSSELIEKLRRFIDRYSHSNVFEVDSESIGNLVSESPSVVEFTLKIIQELDPAHYDEMIDAVQH